MLENGKMMPSVDAWLREAKADSSAPACGMYGSVEKVGVEPHPKRVSPAS